MNKKIANAINGIYNHIQAGSIMWAHYKIASSPLPKHKQKKHDELASQARLDTINAEQVKIKALKKLNPEERKELLTTLGLQ